MENPQAYLGRLKPIHIFRGLTDEQILEVAGELQMEQHLAGEVIFEEGTEGQYFFIIHKGQVRVTRRERGEPKTVAVLQPGDYFGETALMYGRRRSATCAAETAVELLRLSKEDFDALLARYPLIRPNLLVSVESREIYRRHPLPWLNTGEYLYLIARRHPLLLYQALIGPVGAGLLVLALALAGTFYFDPKLGFFIILVGGLAVVAWAWWVYADWGNDFYIVTNRRVIYLEKIIAIYDSRQEAPLGSVMAVNVETHGSIQRAFGIGDVIVRTFSGPIVMKSVPNPRAMAALIEEHWARTRTQQREAEHEAMKLAVRRKIGAAPADGRKPEPPKPAARPPVTSRLGSYFSFQVRFERGDSVVYRKHWFMLLQDIWTPSALLLLLAGVVGLRLGGALLADLPLSVVAFMALIVAAPLAFWWWYQFEDWRNDIYMVTPDQIMDLAKKPFGTESRKAAPLNNVMSLRYERPGLLGLMLNFGTVLAQVAGTEFRFEGVFDPVSVQNDIYRRMEAQKARAAQADAARKRDEIADWLGVYHQVLSEEETKRKKASG